MGMVIRFPDAWRNTRAAGIDRAASEPATVVILPVVRIERQADASPDGAARRAAARIRRRRRPASRS